MSRLATRFVVAAICATAFVAVPMVTPVEAKAASRHVHYKHMKKHTRHWRHHRAWYGYPAQPMAPSYTQSGPICPGIGRSFECKIWPPPYEDDPDRKTSKY
jgi:hypothetical protein